MEKKVSKPIVTKPKVTKPKVTKPKVTKPKVTKPKVTKPKVTKPKVTKPKVTKPKVTKPKVTKPKVTKIQYGGIEYLTEIFVDQMYEYMWQYMNEDTISAILYNAGCGNINVNTVKLNKFLNPKTKLQKKYHNKILYEYINGSDEGHYIYVDKNGIQHGTHENELIYKTDDGICHGAAIYYALTECDNKYYGFGQIYENTNNPHEKKQNYITILKVYLYIIDNLRWEQILENNFYKKYNAANIITSRNLLNELIKNLENLEDDNYVNNNIMNDK